jgi:hypothetical protein
MRPVVEYEARARKFDTLANGAQDPVLRKRYADIAACYRLLAADDRRLTEEEIPLENPGRPQ